MESQNAFQSEFSLESKRSLKSSIGGFSQPAAINHIRTLHGLLAIIQPLQLERFQDSLLYREKWLGEGVSYNVFQCELPQSRKIVAQKEVKLPSADTNFNDFRTRVACVLKDIEVMHHGPLAAHRNIVDLLGYGWNTKGSIPFLITEWAPFGTMRDVLKSSSLTPRAKQKLCRHVATGLLELHLCGIAHGDVKLDNVLIVPAVGDESDCVELAGRGAVIAKVADFGHAVLLSPGTVANADVSQIYRGTRDYNAPEIGVDGLRSSSDMDFRKCDVWSFGCLCLETLRDGVRYKKDDMVVSLIARPEPSTHYSAGLLTPPSESTSLNGSEASPSEKARLCDIAVSFTRKIVSPRCRLDFVQTFKASLEICVENRLGDLARLPLLAPGVYEEVPAMRPQLQEQEGELDQRWSFDTLRPLEALNLAHVAKARILLDTEAQMEQNPSARTAFQIALLHATGFGVPRSMENFEIWARRSSALGLPVADLTLELLRNEPPSTWDNPLVSRRAFYSAMIVERFRERNRDAARKAGFALLSKDTHQLTSPLLAAARVGDYDGVIELIRQGVKPDVTGDDGSLPLHWLFMFPPARQMEICSLLSGQPGRNLKILPWIRTTASPLLSRQVPDSQKLDDQFPIELFGTPLAFAVAAGSYSAVSALLAHGASATALPEHKDGRTWHRSPLQLAVSLHLADITSLLLRSMPHTELVPHIKDLLMVISDASPFERQCVHGGHAVMAFRQTRSEIHRFLVDYGFSTLHPGRESFHPDLAIVPAIQKADVEIVGELLKNPWRFPVNLKRAKAIASPVAVAVSTLCANIHDATTSLDIVGAAIEVLDLKRLNTTPRDFDPMDFVAIAFHNRRDDLLRLFKTGNIDIGFRDPEGRTAFHLMYIKRIKFFPPETMVALGLHVDAQDDTGSTPLHYAVQKGTVDDVKELLAFQVSVNIANCDGSTPLHLATRRRDLPIIELLIEFGADLKIKDATRQTPISLAAKDPKASDVLNRFCQILTSERNAVDGWERYQLARSQLMLVDDKLNQWPLNNIDLVVRRVLYSFTAEAGKDGRTALSLAAGAGLDSLVRFLYLNNPPIVFDFSPDNTGRTPLAWATIGGHRKMVKLLSELDWIQFRTMFTNVDNDGHTAFSSAVVKGHQRTVADLLRLVELSEQAETRSTQKLESLSAMSRVIDLKCNSGWTPLSRAAQQGHEGLVKLLLDEKLKCDVNARNSSGQTPMCLAIIRGHVNIVMQLLSSSDLTARDNLGRSPLSHAASRGQLSIMGLLISHLEEVDVWQEDNEGRTPIWWALEAAQLTIATDPMPFAIVQLLINRDPLKWDTIVDYQRNIEQGHSSPLIEAARRGHDKVVHYLLYAHVVHRDCSDIYGQNALLVAAEFNHPEVVRKIIAEECVSVIAKDSRGRTALMWAVYNNSPETVEALMESKDWNRLRAIRDNTSETPLMTARRFGSNLERIIWLLSGKPIDDVGKNGVGKQDEGWI